MPGIALIACVTAVFASLSSDCRDGGQKPARSAQAKCGAGSGAPDTHYRLSALEPSKFRNLSLPLTLLSLPFSLALSPSLLISLSVSSLSVSPSLCCLSLSLPLYLSPQICPSVPFQSQPLLSGLKHKHNLQAQDNETGESYCSDGQTAVRVG